MASVDDSFDPNDLDSIDALLDEEEQVLAENTAPDTEADALDGLELDELTEDLSSADTSEPDLEAEPDPKSELEPEPESIAELVEEPLSEEASLIPPLGGAEKQTATQNMTGSEGDFVPKRAKSNNTSPNEVSVAEMDSIKKLVIIFGSVLIALVLTAIGMGVWSALAASGGLSEEAQTLIEDIKAGTETNTMANTENSKVVKSVEKKLDAISFQIEQLTADITALEMSTKEDDATTTATVISPILDVDGKPVVDKAVTPTVPTIAVSAVAPVTDQAVLQKLNVVSSKMASAQKRINEVNRRVKTIQTQYGQLMRSVKVVEKQMLDQQAKAAKATAEEKETMIENNASHYQYNRSRDAMYYDQANPDSYP